MYYQSKAEIEAEIVAAGEQACFEANVHGLHPELVKILGRLHYRTSYGQNVLKHSIECAHLAAIMAAELGASEKTARRAALLHDRLAEAELLEQALDALRIVGVHLAPEGGDEVPAHRGTGYRRRPTVSACAAGGASSRTREVKRRGPRPASSLSSGLAAAVTQLCRK